MQSQAPTRFANVIHEENAINARWLSPLIALAFAINPAWGAHKNTADTHVAAKKHHKPTKKSNTARAVPARGSKPKNPATAPVPAAAAVSASATTPQGNPYLPVATANMAGVVVVTPMAPAAVLVQRPVNPYLQPMPYPAAAMAPPQAIVFPAIASTPAGESIPATLTFLPNGGASSQFKSLVPTRLSTLLSGGDGESHWPISFKTVYPTGEKPLWVLTLKCPTEAAFGVAPPPVKLVHIALTAAMDGINYTGLLPVNLQQVCQ